jgi:hypothetical protein
MIQVAMDGLDIPALLILQCNIMNFTRKSQVLVSKFFDQTEVRIVDGIGMLSRKQLGPCSGFP